MADIFATLVCGAETVELARAAAAEHAGGAGMFTTALYAPGNPEPTHYISSGYTPEEIISALTGICEISELSGIEVIAAMGLSLVADGAE